MVDNLSIFLSHGLLALALWRLVRDPFLDTEPAAPDWDQPDAGDTRGDGWAAQRHRAG